MILPNTGRVSQGFTATHQAVDIVDRHRAPIVAPESGVVSFVGQMGSGVNDAGLVVEITCSNGHKHRLCHLDAYTVSNGQSVRLGDLVGFMGYTGYTQPDNVIAGTHLHWIMWVNGARVDGRKYVTGIVDDMINDTDPEFNRWNKSHRMIRGRLSNRATFRIAAVNRTWLQALEILEDDKEAEQHYQYGVWGKANYNVTYTEVAETLYRKKI